MFLVGQDNGQAYETLEIELDDEALRAAGVTYVDRLIGTGQGRWINVWLPHRDDQLQAHREAHGIRCNCRTY